MFRVYISIYVWVLFFIALSGTGQALAETFQIEASRDNTLYESAQGTLSNGSGDYIFVGRTTSNGVRRAVIAFDDLSGIPAGSTVESVRLHLQLSREVSSSTTLSVWRLVSDWGESTSNAPGAEGGGTAPAQGDTTWIHTFFDSQTWVSPGGDFMDSASGNVAIDSVGSYTVESTEAMVNDVQEWLDDPETNYGWILTARESGTTAKRFNSRENSDTASRPTIEVTYTPPQEEPNNNWAGAWFDPSLDGEGYQVFDTPVGWIIYYYGYSPDENHLWLASEVSDIGDPVPGQSYVMKMMVGTPGTFSNPTPSDQLVEWGTLTVNFESCSRGVFELESPNLQLLKTSNVIKIVGIDGTECVD